MNMEGMKKNYRNLTDIEEEIKNVDLKNSLKFDLNRRYEFARFEDCDGPLLGHIKVECSGKEGIRYGSEDVHLF